mmetsp:Transcript_2506/g.7884  ORF Transcript_2506/g.7884 Transcript_2506/m.7884 type:complete len:109 (-) Transcript_2506:14-340(-)
MSAAGDRRLDDAHEADRRTVRAVDDALLRAFCAVQALCAGAIGVAYPAVLCALATWIFIFTGIVVCRELMHPGLPHIVHARIALVLRPLMLSLSFRIHPSCVARRATY